MLENQQAVGNLTHPMTQAEVEFERIPRADPFADFGEPPERQEVESGILSET